MGDMMGAGMGIAMAGQMVNQMNQQGQASAPPPLPGAGQTFHVELNGSAAGPYNAGQLQAAVQSGQVSPTTLVWAPGMAGWTPASQVVALQSLFAAPPPLPPQTPPAAPAG